MCSTSMAYIVAKSNVLSTAMSGEASQIVMVKTLSTTADKQVKSIHTFPELTKQLNFMQGQRFGQLHMLLTMAA